MEKAPKIFCISYQRTGTTSLGQFFKDHQFQVQSYDPEISALWSRYYDIGNYEAIFESEAFQNHQVFEDNPWWAKDFYKYLFHRFPEAKFIIINRDAEGWFKSMRSHSNGRTLGNTFRHSKLYRREREFAKKFPDIGFESEGIDNLLPIKRKHKKHYINVYEARNRELKQFFDYFDASRLVEIDLLDANKWQKLGEFFNIDVDPNYKVHKNKSKK